LVKWDEIWLFKKNKTPYQKEQSLYIISHHHIDMKIILKNGYYRLYQNLNHNSVNLASCGSAGHSTSFIRIRRYLIYRRLRKFYIWFAWKIVPDVFPWYSQKLQKLRCVLVWRQTWSQQATLTGSSKINDTEYKVSFSWQFRVELNLTKFYFHKILTKIRIHADARMEA
jgi:hypothetical protein